MPGQVYRWLRRLPALLLLLGALVACGEQETQTSAPTADAAMTTGTGLKVIATYSILGDLVQNVAGDLVDVRTLVPAGGDAHTFEPSPADSVALAEANLVFENGLEFEPWLSDLFAASGSQARRVVVSEGIDLLEAGHSPGEDEHGDETAAEMEEHADGEFDPHVWHDVNNAVIMVEQMRDSLMEADPASAATYRANADAYLQRLQDLDAYILGRANTLQPEQRKLVTTHDTFAYFARRYGFEIVGTALGSVSTEVADPSAADIVELVEQIKAVGVPALFAENIESGSLMERVAREAGVELAPTLYTDALGEPGSDGESYEKMMRYNIDTIVTALSR